MKDMLSICKKSIDFLPGILLTAICSIQVSCESQYNELPPKTDATVRYALPYPETPTSDEINAFKLIREEYKEATY